MLFPKLSNDDTIKILLLVREQKLKLSHIAKKTNMPISETSRHLQRLSEAKLIEKTADVSYKLTTFGQLTLSLMPSFHFISGHREYLMTHNLSNLPREFIDRIGDLQNCTFTDEIMTVFHHAENLIDEAQEQVWILSNQILISTLKPLENSSKRGVKFKLILPEEFTSPTNLALPTFPNFMERRSLRKVNVIIVLSEKQANFSFPTVSGTLDHIAFNSIDEEARNWCSDLFTYYWQKAEKHIIQL